jgi:hypothetical protein
MPALARAVALKTLWEGGGGGFGAVGLLGNEWNGFALDFLTDTVAVQTSLRSEQLLGSGPSSPEIALAMDFTDNSFAVNAP